MRERGMSLIEVLVAVAIGLIGVLIITQAYITSDKFNRATLGEGGAQTGGMVALYTVERDVRNAGFGIADSGALGCGSLFWYKDPNYSSNISGGTLPNLTLAPVVITVSATASVPDQITIMYSSDSQHQFPGKMTGFNKSSSEVSVDSVLGFKATSPDNMVLLVGPTGCTLAQVTHIQDSPGTQKLQLNPGTSGPYNPSAWGLFPTTYNTGDSILSLGNFVVRSYSIASGRLRVTDALLQSAGASLDIVDGIIDMRAQYGKDNGADNGTVSAANFAPNDGRVDQFSSTAPANSGEWQQVRSIRMGVLARIGNYEKPSAGSANCDATTVAPSWAGGNFGAVDIATATSQDRCYRYRVFETTIPLRNVIWGLSS